MPRKRFVLCVCYGGHLWRDVPKNHSRVVITTSAHRECFVCGTEEVKWTPYSEWEPYGEVIPGGKRTSRRSR